MRIKEKLPELLAPAGSPEALDAAIEAGADAVYFGGEMFSNRMRAHNFTGMELVRSIEKCAAYSVASHITLNTRLRDSELSSALKCAEELYEAGADAFIVADAGLARLIHERMPQAVMHASTQMTGISAADAATLARLGFSRMVCPREISKGELSELVRNSPIEIEIFIHGAHCVSVSGQCLMSWAMGGRSGNRGECAQPCRLPYTAEGRGHSEKYLLSLKDMALAVHIPEIVASGVSSLKIEGRLKSPGYVYGVTRIYRRLLDEKRMATPSEMHELEEIFSRGGFTDGYFRGDMRGMNGIRSDVSKIASVKSAPERISKKLKIKASAYLRCGENIRLTLSCGEFSVTCEGDAPQAAKNAPLDKASVYKNLSKLGSTPYSLDFEDFHCDICGDVFLSAASLNDIRRRAAAELEALIVDSGKRTLPARSISTEAENGAKKELPHIRSAEFLKAENIPEAAYSYFDVIFLPFSELGKANADRFASGLLGLSFSPYTNDSETEKALRFCTERGIKFALAHTVSQLTAAHGAGLSAVASLRLNVMNTESARSISMLGADYVTLSPELPQGALRDISTKTENELRAGAVVYGRLPLMLLKRCVLNADSSCSHNCMSKGCISPSFIKDRKGVKLPVYAAGGGMNTVFNPNVIWSAESNSFREALGIAHFIFTSEDRSEVMKVIVSYENGSTPSKNLPIKRL